MTDELCTFDASREWGRYVIASNAAVDADCHQTTSPPATRRVSWLPVRKSPSWMMFIRWYHHLRGACLVLGTRDAKRVPKGLEHTAPAVPCFRFRKRPQGHSVDVGPRLPRDPGVESSAWSNTMPTPTASSYYDDPAARCKFFNMGGRRRAPHDLLKPHVQPELLLRQVPLACPARL